MKPKITEEEFAAQVLQLARLRGWLTAGFRAARTKDGRWRTPVRGDAKGFPDFVFVRGKTILWIELKTNHGRLAPEQIVWADTLLAAGANYYCWTPNDWRRIEEILT